MESEVKTEGLVSDFPSKIRYDRIFVSPAVHGRVCSVRVVAGPQRRKKRATVASSSKQNAGN